jgi:hypothetical protein
MAMPEVIIEKFLNGKSADLGLRTDAGWWAYECQLPNSVRADLLEDLIAKDLHAGFIRIVLCVKTKKDIEKVSAVIAEMEADPQFADLGKINEKVETKLLADFLG